MDIYLYLLRSLLKNKIILHKKDTNISLTKTLEHQFTIVKGPFAHKKGKEQFLVQNNTYIIQYYYPLKFAYFLSKKYIVETFLKDFIQLLPNQIYTLTIKYDYTKTYSVTNNIKKVGRIVLIG